MKPPNLRQTAFELARRSNNTASKDLKKYRTYQLRPDLWAKDKGFNLTPYQERILLAAANPDSPINRVSPRAPRGAGKTFLSALLMLWFIDVYETLGIKWQVLTTAPVHPQLKDYLWPEFHSLAHQIQRFDTSKNALLDMRYKGKHGLASARTVQPGKSATLEGLHKPRVLIVIEESKSVDNSVFDSIEGSLSQAGVDGNTAIVYAPSTPGAKTGYFYNIHAGKHKIWTPIHVTIQEAIDAGRISPNWVEDMKELWGQDSVLYLHHVMAEFASDDAQAFITTFMLRRSNQRWQQLMNNPATRNQIETGALKIGLDPAGKGKDETVAYFYNPTHNILYRSETEQITENQADLGHKYAIKYPHADLIIDSIGIGEGTGGAAKQVKRPGRTYEFKSNHKTIWKTATGSKAKDERAAAYLNIAEMLTAETDPLAIPDDEKLWADLQAPQLQYLANDTINISSKDQIKQIIGRSPDHGDAATMAVWQPAVPQKARPISLAKHV